MSESNEFEKSGPDLDLKAQRAIADSAALFAEYGGSESLPGLIHQQRRRARRSMRAARILLGFLLATVVAGLAFYLGLPFWQDYVDGRRLTLRATAEAIGTVRQSLDIEAQADKAALVGALEFSAEEIKTIAPSSVFFIAGLPVPDGPVLIAGDQNTVLRYIPETGEPASPIYIEGNTNKTINSFLQLADGRVLIAGDLGTLLLYDPTKDEILGAVETPVSESDTYVALTQTSGGEVLIGGNNSTLLRFDPASDEPARIIPTPNIPAQQYYAIEAITETDFLIAGDQGVLLRYDLSTDTIAGATSLATDFEYEKPILNLGNGRFLIASLNEINIYDANTGTPPQMVNTEDFPSILFLSFLMLDDGTILIGGDESRVFRFDPAEEQALTVVETPPSEAYQAYHVMHQTRDGRVLVAGQAGNILLFDPSGETGPQLRFTPGFDDKYFKMMAPLDDGDVLVGGSQRKLLRMTNRFARNAENVAMDQRYTVPDSKVPGGERREFRPEQRLLDFIEELPEHLRRQVNDIRERLSGNAGKRDVVIQRQRDNDDQLNNLPRYLVDQQLQSFASFMAVCRGQAAADTEGGSGVAAGKSDTVTMACADAWQTRLSQEAQNWWQTLATQVPPGILLLFLLATLGGLYRYNLRIAGFHNSRADALEMLAMGHAGKDIDQLIKLSDALAADKVEFGKGNTPADQAMEMLKAYLARTRV